MSRIAVRSLARSHKVAEVRYIATLPARASLLRCLILPAPKIVSTDCEGEVSIVGHEPAGMLNGEFNSRQRFFVLTEEQRAADAGSSTVAVGSGRLPAPLRAARSGCG